MNVYKGIRIPVHGFVGLTKLETTLLDTPWMNRLKRIGQTALTNEVYPGAVHTRFEHSIGVLHIVTRMFNSIFQPEKKNKYFLRSLLGYSVDIKRREKWLTAIRLAALLHDIGHPPFSHAGESLLPFKNRRKKELYTHEDYTAAIIRGPLRRIIENRNLNPYNEITADLVANFFDNKALLREFTFWQPLISGQLDADRCDYLLRDSLHLGVNYGLFDLERIIETITIAQHPDTETETPVIALEEGGRQAAEGLIIARYMMFIQVYFHRTRKAFDHHLEEALKQLLPDGHYPRPTTVGNLNKYLDWDDTKVWQLLKSKGKNNPDSQALINRTHDKCYAESVIIPEGEMAQQLEKERIEEIEEYIGLDHKWTDKAEKEWYKHAPTDNPIYIVDLSKSTKRQTRELRAGSSIIYKLDAANFIRLYTDSTKAKKVRKKIKGRFR